MDGEKMIKRYLRSGVMQNGVVVKKGGDSQQEGSLSLLLANVGVVKRALTKERLIKCNFYDLATAYQSVHINY